METKDSVATIMAEQILTSLEKQTFVKWYETDFAEYMQSGISKEQILKQIKLIFNLK
jgi:hypothetical protein